MIGHIELAEIINSSILELSLDNVLNNYNEFIWDREIKVLNKDGSLNIEMINQINDQNSGFHYYQMILDLKNQKFIPLIELVHLRALDVDCSHIRIIQHYGAHFNVTVNEVRYVCYSLHTSHKKYHFSNQLIENIKINEKGIKYVNPLTIMRAEDFNQYCAILNHKDMWPTYHKNQKLGIIFDETMNVLKTTVEDERWYIIKDNKIKEFDKGNLQFVNEVIQKFQDNQENPNYRNQFINNLLKQEPYPKEIVRYFGKKLY